MKSDSDMFSKKLQFASKFNPVWKRVAKRFSEKCESCNQPRLYSIFNTYITGDNPDCKGCSTAFQLARPLINRTFRKTYLDEEAVKKLMADNLIRKSMLNVVRGIGHFGLKTPQTTAVPVVIVWNYTNRCNLDCLHCHQNSGCADEDELGIKEALN